MTILRANVTPAPKPRMTRRDKWKQRPSVMRYRAYCDAIRASGLTVEDGDHVQFWLPMPKSWSKRKQAESAGKPHKQKPDLDNLLKALFDALHEDDAHISAISAEKGWARKGEVVIYRGGENEQETSDSQRRARRAGFLRSCVSA